MRYLLFLIVIAFPICAIIEKYNHDYIQKLAQDYVVRSTPYPKSDAQSFSRPLFKLYPKLKDCIAHLNLAQLPTPIHRLEAIEKEFAGLKLYLKDDGKTGKTCMESVQLFGGNKLRKLEFIFGDALKHGAESIITFGGVGSNHAAASATYAHILGLKPLLFLHHQKNNVTVQRNILFMHDAQAQFFIEDPTQDFDEQVDVICSDYLKKHGALPYLMPCGGSSTIGTIGFVNAAFELKEQVDAGLLPEPDYIYIPYGTGGSTSGLIIGLHAAGLKTKVISVVIAPVKDPERIYRKTVCKVRETSERLHHASNGTFPIVTIEEQDLLLDFNYGGPAYGEYDQACLDAIEYFKTKEDCILDPVYTGKLAAGLLPALSAHAHKKEVVLFWKTFYSDKRLSKKVDHIQPPFIKYLESIL